MNMTLIKSSSRTYVIKSIIYIGPFGDTFVAADENDPYQLFQLTIENKEIIEDRGGICQVQSEHCFLTAMRHRNMVNCIEIFEDEKNFYVVCDYFSETTLERRLVELNRIPESKLQLIFQQLIDVLIYLHTMGYAFGAIRSDCILINDRYGVVLSNFSCVQSLTLPIPRKNFVIPPPEILTGQCLSSSLCEVFSLGVLLYMIASRGLKPWDTPYDNELIRMYQNSMLMQPPTMSHACFVLVKGMLELQTNRRYSMIQVQQNYWVQRGQKTKIASKSPLLRAARSRRTSTSMRSLVLTDERRKSENNPSLANIGIAPIQSMKHRQSGLTKQSKLPHLDLLCD